MDNIVITTFNMLVDRLSDVELLVSQQQQALEFEQCLRHGYINHSALGLGFPVFRSHRLSTKNDETCDPSAPALIVKLEFSTSCHCEWDPLAISFGKDFKAWVPAYSPSGQKNVILLAKRPEDVGWIGSPYDTLKKEASNRLLNKALDGTDFKVHFLEFDEQLEFALINRTLCDIPISNIIKMIPLIVKKIGCRNSCILRAEVIPIDNENVEKL